jgi:hypothetical protein
MMQKSIIMGIAPVSTPEIMARNGVAGQPHFAGVCPKGWVVEQSDRLP